MAIKFKPQIFVCPIDQESNQSIAQHPSLLQVEPCINQQCFFGSTAVVLSIFPVDNLAFNTFKRSNGLAFYSFVQNEKDGKKHYFYSQNVKKQKDNLAIKMAGLLEKLERSKGKVKA